MSVLSPADLLAQLQWRYATKKFDTERKISPEHWRALEEALVLTPSSFGLQPWRFVVVTDPEVKTRLKAVSWNQDQPVGCSHYVVFALRDQLSPDDIEHYLDRIVEVRGVEKDKLAGFRKMMLGTREQMLATGVLNEWATRQVYIALGNFMTAAAVLGIDACPMEGIEPAKYDEILGLKSHGFTTVVACAAGYRAADDKTAAVVKVRFPVDEVVQRI